MRSAAAYVRERRRRRIDINMGCPVPKVCKTGAGAALLAEPDTAVAVARAAREGSRPAGHREAALRPARRGAQRLRARPPARRGRGRRRRSASIRARPRCTTRARPTTRWRRSSSRSCPRRSSSPAGCATRAVRAGAYEQTGAAAIMLARGSLGNPWLFAQLLGDRDDEPSESEVLAELDWLMDRAVEHLGEVRAGRWLRKAYPWYVERLGGGKALQGAMQQTDTVEAARACAGRALQPERGRLGPQLERERGQRLGAVLGDEEQVLDAHAAVAVAVRPGSIATTSRRRAPRRCGQGRAPRGPRARRRGRVSERTRRAAASALRVALGRLARRLEDVAAEPPAAARPVTPGVSASSTRGARRSGDLPARRRRSGSPATTYGSCRPSSATRGPEGPRSTTSRTPAAMGPGPRSWPVAPCGPGATSTSSPAAPASSKAARTLGLHALGGRAARPRIRVPSSPGSARAISAAAAAMPASAARAARRTPSSSAPAFTRRRPSNCAPSTASSIPPARSRSAMPSGNPRGTTAERSPARSHARSAISVSAASRSMPCSSRSMSPSSSGSTISTSGRTSRTDASSRTDSTANAAPSCSP